MYNLLALQNKNGSNSTSKCWITNTVLEIKRQTSGVLYVYFTLGTFQNNLQYSFLIVNIYFV